MILYADAQPSELDVNAGDTATFIVSVTNSSDVIDAYSVEIYGVDPQWVTAVPDRLALFPGVRGEVELTVALPRDYPSAMRMLALNVRSENDPGAFALADVRLSIIPMSELSVRVEPNLVMGGRRATFGMLVRNAGNVEAVVPPFGVDPEALATFTFDPPIVRVPAGETTAVRVTAQGGRAWMGQLKPRSFTLGVTAEPPLEASAVFLQRPRIGRWLLTLLGFLLAAAAFAFVLNQAFGGVVDKAKLDARIVEAALNDGTGRPATIPVTPARLGGRLLASTSSEANPIGVGGIQVSVFSVDDPVVPAATAVSDGDGNFTVGGLKEGDYLLQFAGAGFDAVWYPDSDTAAEATPVTARIPKPGDPAPAPLEPVTIGGQPGSVAGVVTGGNPVGALATLEVPSEIVDGSPAVVAQAMVSADGSFLFERIPAPADYTLVVVQHGYATERRPLRLEAAEQLDDVEVTLRPGDGTITGSVVGPDGPLGGVQVTATSAADVVSTVTLTVPDGLGTFTLRNLPVPGRYTVTVRAADHAPATSTVVLDDDEKVRVLSFNVTPAIGEIRGIVSLDDLGPAGGVAVAVTGPQFEMTTTSVSAESGLGSFLVGKVPSPGVYTVTFTRAGYVPQVLQVELGGTTTVANQDSTLVTATGVIGGSVQRFDGQPAAGAEILITDGTTEYRTTSADDPAGQFEVSGLPPASYTVRARLVGTTDAVQIVNLLPSDERVAGSSSEIQLRLGIQATIGGRVVHRATDGSLVPVAHATVRLVPIADFPSTFANGTAVACTNADGTFEFPALEGGQVFVAAVYLSPLSPPGSELDAVQVTSADGTIVPTSRDLVIVGEVSACP